MMAGVAKLANWVAVKLRAVTVRDGIGAERAKAMVAGEERRGTARPRSRADEGRVGGGGEEDWDRRGRTSLARKERAVRMLLLEPTLKGLDSLDGGVL